jgi:hypothetical protein
MRCGKTRTLGGMLTGISARRVKGVLYAIAVVLPAVVWLIPWMVARMEAWDHWSYWYVSLPLMIIFAYFAGFLGKSRPWRWPLVMLLVQLVVSLTLLSGGPLNLLPLGVVAFVILAVPAFIAAWVGGWYAKREGEQHAS